MTREFFRKILKLRIYDTRNYRYVVREYGNICKIERLPISMLGRSCAWNMDNWQVVAVYA